MKFESERKLAIDAARKAGMFLEDHTDVLVDSAVGKDIKLANDRKSEEIIVDILKVSGIPILSEERGMTEGSRDTTLRWIVDPLDGSANLWKGMKELTCVSIALWEGNEPLIGVVYRFHMNELYQGVTGEGAYLNDTPIHTSGVAAASEAVLATGFPVKRSYDEESLSRFVKKVQNFKKIRMLGAAAVMGAFVSCGRIDAYQEEDIMLWDIAASTALVKTAGGYTEVHPSGDHKCLCTLFANKALYEDFEERSQKQERTA